ncbi:nSTAND3 domain-containing NTPase [Nitrospira sp. Nam80]
MSNYDFKTLSSHDFEECVRDLLQVELKLRLESFKAGRDQGIDLRYSTEQRVFPSKTLIVQCKHYAESGFSRLCRDLKDKEYSKIERIKPSQYIIATSVSLSPSQKNQIIEILKPFCRGTQDVYGREDLNNLLRQHPEIERKNFKLWLSSEAVLSRIIHSTIYNQTEVDLENIKQKIKLYVQNESFFRAQEILDELHYCIIAGIPGIGKTTLAEILLVHYLSIGYEPLKVTNDIAEAFKVLEQGKRQIFYYDDFLGQTSLGDKLHKNEDDNLLRFIDMVQKSKNTRLLLTTREYILAQAKQVYEKLSRSNMDYKKCVIDLSDYKRSHRAKILYNHVYFSGLKPHYLADLLRDRRYMRIIGHPNFNPRIIEWMTSYVEAHGIMPREYYTKFMYTLDNPSKLWEHAFESQLSHAARHILIVLSSMPSQASWEDVQKAFTGLHSARASQYRFSISPMDYKRAMKELEGNFINLSKVGETILVRYHNPSIKDFIIAYLKENLDVCAALVKSCCFFTQVMELWGSTANAKEENGLRSTLIKLGNEMVDAVDRLFCSSDCTLTKQTTYDSAGASERMQASPIPWERRSIHALDISRHLNEDGLRERVIEAMIELMPRKGTSLSYLLNYIAKHEIPVSQSFIETTKQTLLQALMKNHEFLRLDDFDLAIEFSELFSSAVSKEEFEEIRKDFKDAYNAIVDGDLSDLVYDTDSIRQYADQLSSIGEKLNVDVDAACDQIRETADEIDARHAEEPNYNDDDWRGAASELEMGTDEQIHSMFDSLR